MYKAHWIPASLVTAILTSSIASASPAISGGIWFNYRYVDNDPRDEETAGDIADEALIIYVNDTPEDKAWSLAAEVRFGPGSFTDTANNSTGDNFTVHKAWIGYQVSDNSQLKIGKSQVPFGWKTVNFWPGDILLAGYGDQMDVGLKYSHESTRFRYDLAYYHADDWGETSTDSTDDNRHWGSATTYRKVQTVVGNIELLLNEQHRFGFSAQAGGLQDLTSNALALSPADTAENDIVGDHTAFNVHYYGQWGDFYAKAQYITMEREDLPVSGSINNGIARADTFLDVENDRKALELGYTNDNWFYYLDASWASPETRGNDIDDIAAYAPGLSYHYGSGWIYLEYLTQDGFVDRNGMLNEGDFDAFYASIDYYF